MPKLQAGGNAVFWSKIVKRTSLIFVIGLLLTWFPFVRWVDDSFVWKEWVSTTNPQSGIRILGVLQRIALCYFFASILIYYCKIRTVIWVSSLILLFYWFACLLFGGSDPYSLANWFGTAIDFRVLGEPHMYKGEGVPFDPEGIVSTVTAVVQVVLGYLVGRYIRTGTNLGSSNSNLYQVVSNLMVIAALMTLAGLFWGLAFPINKKIWTSSFVLYTSGLAITTLSVLIWFIEIKRITNGITRFFDVFGKNPLFIKIAHGHEDGVQQFTSPLRWFYTELCAKVPGPPEVGSFVYAVSFLVFLWGICYILDKKKIYIKV